jgi:hypothetical protein
MSRKLTYGWTLLAVTLSICSCSAPLDLKPQGNEASREVVGRSLAGQSGRGGNLESPGAPAASKRWLIITYPLAPKVDWIVSAVFGKM